MRTKFYYSLSLQVFALFGILILCTFIPDYLHGFFGDTFCKGNISPLPIDCPSGWSRLSNTHGETWHWGYRHWLWFTMGLCLFIIQIVRIVSFMEDKYPNAA